MAEGKHVRSQPGFGGDLIVEEQGVGPTVYTAAVGTSGSASAFLAATTLVIAAGYTLWLYKRIFFGEVGNAHVATMKDIGARETLVLSVFAVGVLALGVYPKPLTDLMEPSIAQLAMQIANSKL